MTSFAASVRPAAVAGLFYPRERNALAREVEALLDEARRRTAGQAVPKALLAPHAGYVYSGAIAASAYALFDPACTVIERVVVLGPTHRVPVRGLAVPGVSRFETPLGTVDVDLDAVALLRGLPQVVASDAAHALEHALEVQLPFLQTVFERFTVVPLAVGEASTREVAAAIDLLWGGPETLIVVSSDLSHYLGYREAQAIDAETAETIVGLRSDIDHERACGATPLCGLMSVAKRRGLRPQLLDLRNSGDTAGDRSRVVGYGAFAFYEGGDAR
jgi:MEMO1 family protein